MHSGLSVKEVLGPFLKINSHLIKNLSPGRAGWLVQMMLKIMSCVIRIFCVGKKFKISNYITV